MNIEKVFENNKEWAANKLNVDASYFDELTKGQSPEILYIGCADSRVSAESMMGAEPGEVFVHRNVANVISNMDDNSLSVINYAVNHLKVKHLVVCGHTFCGGVKAAMGNDDLGPLNPWLKNIRDVYRLHHVELDAIADENDRYNRLIELNVMEQCINAYKSMEVQEKVNNGSLQIHAWVFDIKTGLINDLNFDVSKVKGMNFFKVH